MFEKLSKLPLWSLAGQTQWGNGRRTEPPDVAEAFKRDHGAAIFQQQGHKVCTPPAILPSAKRLPAVLLLSGVACRLLKHRTSRHRQAYNNIALPVRHGVAICCWG